MIKSLRCDIIKTMLSFGFLAAILVTFLLCFTETVYVNNSTMQSFSGFEALIKFDRSFMERNTSFCSLLVFEKALSGYSAMFLPILASFPFVFSQNAERNSGYIRFSIIRTKRLKYYSSKFISAVLCGSMCVMLGVIIFGVFSAFAFPSIECYPDLNPEYYAPDGIIPQIIKKLLSSLIYGGISAVPAFFLSAFCRNRYIILCVPFLIRFMYDTAIRKILMNSTEETIYKKIFPFECDAPSQIPYLEAGHKLISVILINVIFASLMLFGYIMIMELRIDKGD